jgi:RNA polymerase sigma-70 factor (ECF subfamily)
LFAVVHAALRHIAARLLQTERRDHTLEPNAVVNELCVRLIGSQPISYRDRAHFFAIAAQMMRRILVDHARARVAGKRGGHQHRVPLSGVDVLHDAPSSEELLDLNTLLSSLEHVDPRAACVVELRFFGGAPPALSAPAKSSLPGKSTRMRWAVVDLPARWFDRPPMPHPSLSPDPMPIIFVGTQRAALDGGYGRRACGQIISIRKDARCFQVRTELDPAVVLIQLLLPTRFPNGTASQDATAALAETRRELAEAFDGLTAYVRSPASGVWTAPDGRTEQDDVVMVEVVTHRFDRVWWRAYVDKLAARFRQHVVHVRAIPIELLDEDAG